MQRPQWQRMMNLEIWLRLSCTSRNRVEGAATLFAAVECWKCWHRGGFVWPRAIQINIVAV